MNPNRNQFGQQSDSADESDRLSYLSSIPTNFLATNSDVEAFANFSNALFVFNQQQQQEQQVSITNNILVQQTQQILINSLSSYVNNALVAQATAQYVAQKIYAEKHHNNVIAERPPAEPNVRPSSSLQPQEYWTAGNWIFNDETNYLKYKNACDKASNTIRTSIPDSDELHPHFYGSDFPKYELFGEDVEFNFASPGPLDPIKFPKPIPIDDYDEMRRDFDSNGQEVVDLFKVLTLPKVNIFQNLDFPPLQIQPEQVTKLNEIWEDRCDIPIRSMNAIITPRRSFENNNNSRRRGIARQPFEEVSLKYLHFKISLL